MRMSVDLGGPRSFKLLCNRGIPAVNEERLTEVGLFPQGAFIYPHEGSHPWALTLSLFTFHDGGLPLLSWALLEEQDIPDARLIDTWAWALRPLAPSTCARVSPIGAQPHRLCATEGKRAKW
jgi:hypothetical protein